MEINPMQSSMQFLRRLFCKMTYNSTAVNNLYFSPSKMLFQVTDTNDS